MGRNAGIYRLLPPSLPLVLMLPNTSLFRDIKLENILLDADNQMKLIDFGLSAFFIPGKKLRVHCGG